MRFMPGEEHFFLNSDREVNLQVFKIGGIFMLVLFAMWFAAYEDIFKVSTKDVQEIILLLFVVEAVFLMLLKLNAPVEFVKYYGLMALEFCLMTMSVNAYFGVYITYILIPAISCLYFDRRLTRITIGICFVCMLVALWMRAPGAIELAYPGYTRESWFVAFGLGYTMEYAAVSAVLISVSRRTRRYMQELYKRNETINDIQKRLIFSLADIVESRDDNTGKHVKRTSKYVEMLAKRLAVEGPYVGVLTDKDIINIGLAAPLHDIGKVKVPDAILLKPGKLTPEEFEQIKLHTIEGGNIVSASMSGIEEEEFMEIARDIALSHHEKWNGTGYPRGLAGLEISLPARIMAVADVFDALVSERCYKQAVTMERAFEILRAESGSHFEPYLVEAFISQEAEVRKIMEEH